MNRFFSLIMMAAFALALTACNSKTENPQPAAAPQAEAAKPEAAVAQAEPAAAPAVAEQAAKPEAAGAQQPAAAGAEAGEESPDDPDDDGTWDDGKAAGVDRDKLAKAYEEVYCAQKKGEMDKILDIYKANGFEKPEDFISTWVEAARDTSWVTKIATDAAAKCK